MGHNINQKTDKKLDEVIHNKAIIEIWIGGELDYVGQIVSYTSDIIKIPGWKYIRSNCEIK